MLYYHNYNSGAYDYYSIIISIHHHNHISVTHICLLFKEILSSTNNCFSDVSLFLFTFCPPIGSYPCLFPIAHDENHNCSFRLYVTLNYFYASDDRGRLNSFLECKCSQLNVRESKRPKDTLSDPVSPFTVT